MTKAATKATKRRQAFRVRPVSRSTRFLRLRSLKCFPEVHQHLLDGWPIAELVRFIQQDHGEYTEITEASLNSLLTEYRSTIPPGDLVRKTLPPVYAKAAQEVREGLDEVGEMEKLYRIQMERVGIDLANEKTVKKLFPTMTREIDQARQILASSAELKMDLGLADRHIGQVDVNAQITADIEARFGKAVVVKVLNDPNSRRKLLGAIERISALSTQKVEPTEEKVLDAEPVPEEESELDAIAAAAIADAEAEAAE